MKLFIGIVLAAGLGTVAATIAIGSAVREEQVVDRPYEAGLGYDADRAARAALGWTARVDDAGLAAGASVVRFTLWDGAGAPLDGADVTVSATRAETSRDRASAAAKPLGHGAYAAELAFAEAGPWVVELDVRRGKDHLALERSVTVAAVAPSPLPSPPATRGSGDTARGERGSSGASSLSARARRSADAGRVGGAGAREGNACDVAKAPCTVSTADGTVVTLDLAPRPLKAFAELQVAVSVLDGADRPISSAEVSVAFEMPGMFMGENRAVLAPAGAGRYAGKAVLVRCASGRRDWRATVSVRRAGMAPESVPFEFRVEE